MKQEPDEPAPAADAAAQERVVYKVCPKCRFDCPEPMEACPSCGIIYSDFVPPEGRRPPVLSTPAGPRVISKVPLVLAVVSLVLAVWWANVFNLEKELVRVRGEAGGAAGIDVSVHYGSWVRPSVLVFDLKKVEPRHRPADVFALFLVLARALSDRGFERVVLECRGRERFHLSGWEFRRLGRELGVQSVAYTVRSFPEKLRLPSGAPAFTAWNGEPEDVVPKQLADVVEVHRRWYRSDLGLTGPVDLESPADVASQLVGVEKVESWAPVSIANEEAEPGSRARARLVADSVEFDPPDSESRVLVRGVVRNDGLAAGCRVSLRLTVVAEDGRLLGSAGLLMKATVKPGGSESFQAPVLLAPSVGTPIHAAAASIERFKETCR